ncbi:ATP-binding cassette domain-containing protein [Cohnella abietis]|uniref:ABC transporter ATP-binding protein n=1 Tax=Cohnella abietis TaxID=2507935 RepID=A0A3T1DAZ8_9BACL|nr:ATP-binding cassette domain-containing protein [Cohnella abietis]BBI35185.1 ABC transporter ATP-binding protein [Cohnella abietis]
MIQLRLHDVSFRQPDVALPVIRQTSLTLAPGLYYLFGANGSGKSTLLKGLAGILAPASGNISLARHNQVIEGMEYKLYTGYAPQEASYYNGLTVMQYLKYIAGMRLIPAPLIASRIEDVTRLLGLTGMGKRRLELLSVGQKKRLMLVQAVLADPDLLLLDEPLAHADPHEKEMLSEWMSEGGREKVIIVAHHPSERKVDSNSHILFIMKGQLMGPYSSNELITELDGRIVSCRVPKLVWEQEKGNCRHQGLHVLSVKYNADSVEVRMLMEIPGSMPMLPYEIVSPTMEDVFMYFQKVLAQE